MTLLVPDPCSPIGFDQLQAHLDESRGVVTLCWFFSVELDAAQVFGADEAVLIRADHSRRCPMVAVERVIVEVLSDEHVVGQRVFDQHDGPVVVEAFEHDMGDWHVRSERRLDDHSIEGLEGDALPAQVGGRPSSHAVEVGGELSPGKRRELSQSQGEGFGHGAADLDHRLGGDRGRGPMKVRAESRERIDRVLATGERHVGAPREGAADHARCPSRNIAG